MDQLKEFLKLAVKYRFWIVVGVATLLPMIGYFASASSINQQADTKAGEVKTAFSNVQQYESGLVPNADWQSLTEERTTVLTDEIRKAWDLLYKDQAPLLTWPPEVSDKYTAWGPEWPPGVSPSEITLTNGRYAAVYPDYVTKVYSSFRPFDYVEGTGLVVAPEKNALLRPVTFPANSPPTLGKVWAAQQKLWIQNAVLDVVDRVNRNADDWDSAPIKQITGLEVASPQAQDQKSIVEGVELVVAPEIVRPGSESAATASPAAGVGEGADPFGNTDGYESAMRGSGGYGAMSGGMMGGGTQSVPDEVYIFEQAQGQQFREVPVYIAVLIEQSRILDLLDAFRRSPMANQVVDFEMKRPDIKVEKPEKGQKNPGFSSLSGLGEMFMGGNAMMGMYGRGGMMGDMEGYGGGMGGYPGMGGMGGYEDMMRGSMSSGGYGGMMDGYGGMGRSAPKKPQGTDIASEQYKKLQEKAKSKDQTKEDEAKKAAAKSSLSDPYFNIVEVHVYGRARFYDPPPAEEEQPESLAADNLLESDADAIPGEDPVEPTETTSDPAGVTPEAGVLPAEPAVTPEPAPPLTTTPEEVPAETPPAAPETPPAEPAAPAEDVPAETPTAEPATSPEPGR